MHISLPSKLLLLLSMISCHCLLSKYGASPPNTNTANMQSDFVPARVVDFADGLIVVLMYNHDPSSFSDGS